MAEADAAIRRRAHLDPSYFARRFLRRPSRQGDRLRLWWRQREILTAVARHKRVAVRSGHKVGKSTAAVVLALWWLCTRARATVVMTAPSFRQVKAVLWKELKRVVADHALLELGLGARIADDPETGLRLADGREIVGVSTNEPDRMGGYSGTELLFIGDEASGIPDPIFEAISGNTAGGAKQVLFGNPLRTTGVFFQAFHDKSAFWHGIHVSSEHTPNALTGLRVVPGLAEQEWIEEQRAEHGEKSAIFQVRARGNFPIQGTNSVIALHLVEEAQERFEEAVDQGVLNIGVDVARYGDDDTVIQPRRSFKAYPFIELHHNDVVEVANEVRRIAKLMRDAHERVRVTIDDSGVGGGVTDILKRDSELDVYGVNVGESPTSEGFGILRDQLWYGIRDWLRAGGAFPADEKLTKELLAPVYVMNARGGRCVSQKPVIKKLIHRSPDRADALALSIYQAPKKAAGPGVLVLPADDGFSF